ncbi:MAG: hypothetical protein ACODAD_06515 [Planctomycetota bacterium]
MSAASLFKQLYFTHFAKPLANRTVFRTIMTTQAGHLVLMGLGDGQLARNMIQLAQHYTSRTRVRFTGIDLFELRTGNSSGLPLKRAHQMLHSLPAHTRLIPGDPFEALARHANSLLNSDLLVIQADQLGPAMDRAWFYVPRMLHERSVVLVNRAGQNGQPDRYEPLDGHAIQRLAQATGGRRRAA